METKRLLRHVLILGLFILSCISVAAGTDKIKCAACGRRITGQYLVANGVAYCSQACYERILPKCAVCGRVARGPHPVSGDLHYCSEACFEKTLPACEICGRPVRRGAKIGDKVYCHEHEDLPRCLACGLPVARGLTMQDGRVIHNACLDSVVFDIEHVKPLYIHAADVVFSITSLRSPKMPELQMAWMDEIRRQLNYHTESGIVQRGLYIRNEEITQKTNVFGRVVDENRKVDKKVVLLYGMPPEKVVTTSAHELTHDLLAEFFPELRESAPLWAEEGICQYVSALVCRRRGYRDILREIENCEDAVYGDGYRFIKSKVGEDNWQALVNWIRITDFKRLPQKAPVR